MLKRTSIEWTDYSVNPVRARHRATGKVGWHCEMHSPGCAHCYSATLDGRFGTGEPYNRRGTEAVEMFLDERALRSILVPRPGGLVFPCDMTDLFWEGIAVEVVDRVMASFLLADWHTFQILTKRSDRMSAYVRDPETPLRLADAVDALRPTLEGIRKADWGLVSPLVASLRRREGWPAKNLWWGTSVEDQERAAERLPDLIRTPGRLRFVSGEPLLSRVDLGPYLCDFELGRGKGKWNLNWVIVGGESGGKARPCDVAWIRSIVRQCGDVNVPCFVKQLGTRPVSGTALHGDARGSAEEERSDLRLRDKKGGDMGEWPEDLRIRRMPEGVRRVA